MTHIADRVHVIDSDTHISEPEDLWTARLSKEKWGDLIPRVENHPKGKRPDGQFDRVWMFNGKPTMYVASGAMAGTPYCMPDHPASLEEAHPGSYKADARVEWMDANGVYAQVVYPNVGGFGSGRFLSLNEPELMLECVQAYNDFLAEWCSATPERFIPIMAMPFWDVNLCVQEISRAAKIGHKGILFGSEPQSWGQPPLMDQHWNPFFAAAQDAGLSLNFHIGSGNLGDQGQQRRSAFTPENGRYTNTAIGSTFIFMDNCRALATLIMGGVCHRFPDLKFVSVESGIGWIPTYVESMDWQWLNMGAHGEHPERDLLPSEYFRRQVYGCFWFEKQAARNVLETYPDNWMFETDFPHPTSLAEGPVSSAPNVQDWIDETMGDWPEDLVRKVLHDNAAMVYRHDL